MEFLVDRFQVSIADGFEEIGMGEGQAPIRLDFADHVVRRPSHRDRIVIVPPSHSGLQRRTFPMVTLPLRLAAEITGS